MPFLSLWRGGDRCVWTSRFSLSISLSSLCRLQSHSCDRRRWEQEEETANGRLQLWRGVTTSWSSLTGPPSCTSLQLIGCMAQLHNRRCGWVQSTLLVSSANDGVIGELLLPPSKAEAIGHQVCSSEASRWQDSRPRCTACEKRDVESRRPSLCVVAGGGHEHNPLCRRARAETERPSPELLQNSTRTECARWSERPAPIAFVWVVRGWMMMRLEPTGTSCLAR